MASHWLLPGSAHPQAHLTWDEVAERLRVSPSRVTAWRDRGLPGTTGIDGFALANWVAAHALDEAPALARRWRMFLAHFRPFVNGNDTSHRIRVRRHHALVIEPPCACPNQIWYPWSRQWSRTSPMATATTCRERFWGNVRTAPVWT